jgi:hypothetical protein
MQVDTTAITDFKYDEEHEKLFVKLIRDCYPYNRLPA